MTDSTATANGRSNHDGTAWNASLLECGSPCLLQAYEWGQLKQAFGWQVLRFACDDGMAQVLVRSTPVGKIAYVPRGPALRADGSPATGLASLMPSLHAACRAAGAFALKLEPNWPDHGSGGDILLGLGLRPSPQTVQPASTVIVDVSGAEEAILSRMRPKTRYNVRLAGRKGVTVRPGSRADLPAFSALMSQTGRRDGFGVHPPAYYQRAFTLFEPAGMAALLIAEHDGSALAALMVFSLGTTAYYLYGASSDERRNLMPTYALQWEAMRWARSQGCLQYDLWGIPDDVGRDPMAYADCEPAGGEGLWGVWRFKRGFGGRVVRHIGAWDFVYRPAAYRLYGALLKLRRRTLAG